MDLDADQRFCRNLFRVFGLAMIWISMLVLIANLVETYGTVSLAYWQSYLRSEIARPLIFWVGGWVVFFSAAKCSRWVVR